MPREGRFAYRTDVAVQEVPLALSGNGLEVVTLSYPGGPRGGAGLALRLADSLGVTVVGYVRNGRLPVTTHPPG